MQGEIKFTIRLAPVTKKNHGEIALNKKTGKPFVLPSKQYRDYAESAVWFIPNYGITWKVNVKALFYMPTARRVDLTNLLESLDDTLVLAGLLKDDNCNIVGGHDGSRVYIDRENPRTEVIITAMEEE